MSLEGPKCNCKDNVKMDLGETEWGVDEWIYLDQDRGR
jgi:hypothetical protein